jgi:hypothetical protein
MSSVRRSVAGRNRVRVRHLEPGLHGHVHDRILTWMFCERFRSRWLLGGRYLTLCGSLTSDRVRVGATNLEGRDLKFNFGRKRAAALAAMTMAAGSLVFVGAVANGAVTTVDANATTCAQVGFSGSTILGSGGNGQANDTVTSDAVVEVTISAYTGPDAADDAQKINISDGPAAGYEIHAVIVKGGDAYNKYTGADIFGDMIAPQNGGENVPQISHWFLCYSALDPGALSVSKSVVADGVEGVPATFEVDVDCTDGTEETLTLVGNGPSQVIDDIAAGATCTVTEGTTGLDPVPAVSYSANGVPIISGDTAVVVVTNTYTSTPPVVPEITPDVTPEVTPEVAPAVLGATAAITVAPAFTG